MKRGGPLPRPKRKIRRRKRMRQRGARKRREEKAIKAFRFAVFERDGYRCQRCKRKPPYGARGDWLQAHHIRMQSQAKLHHLSNGVALCWECHDAIHHHTAEDWRSWIKQRTG